MDIVPIPPRQPVQNEPPQEEQVPLLQGHEVDDDGVDLYGPAPQQIQPGAEIEIGEFMLQEFDESLHDVLSSPNLRTQEPVGNPDDGSKVDLSDDESDGFEKIENEPEVNAKPGNTLEVKVWNEDKSLTRELHTRAIQDLDTNPKGFLKFVGKNTNPDRARFRETLIWVPPG
jgi:hypothetical protein